MRQVFSAAVLAATLAGWGGFVPAASGAEQLPVPADDYLAEDYGGLPDGPGRAAVYFNCTACHSLNQFAQQRLTREDWDALLDVMVEKNKMHPLEPWARRQVLNYLATHFGQDEEDWEGLPPGPGREEVFYICQACHSLAIVKQQGLPRYTWDELLVWMVEEQGMVDLEPDERALVLEYLATNYGRESASAQ